MTNNGVPPTRRLLVYLYLAAAFFACSGCERESQMAPLPPTFSVIDLSKVPLILVGQALENCHPAGPPEYSRWDHRLVQIWTVRVEVEHVVQGEIQPKNLDIFYFVDQGAYTGGWSHLTNIYKGHSEVFFLQRDGSHWRTICDGWRICVLWVRTGTHYQYKIDHNLQMKDILVNLMLSRGDHTSDKQMIDAIYYPETRWGWKPIINKLQQLVSEDKSPQVRAVALKELRERQKYYANGAREIP